MGIPWVIVEILVIFKYSTWECMTIPKVSQIIVMLDFSKQAFGIFNKLGDFFPNIPFGSVGKCL